MRTQTKKLTQGFTIIEVMIVLAIAGLILAIIFLAVPALQRNSRNNSRNSDAAHLAGLVNDYVANHAGNLPTGVGASGAGNIDLTNENWAIVTAPVSADFGANSTFGTTSTLRVNLDRTCNSATNQLATQSRAFAVTYQVETGGAAQNKCIQG